MANEQHCEKSASPDKHLKKSHVNIYTRLSHISHVTSRVVVDFNLVFSHIFHTTWSTCNIQKTEGSNTSSQGLNKQQPLQKISSIVLLISENRCWCTHLVLMFHRDWDDVPEDRQDLLKLFHRIGEAFVFLVDLFVGSLWSVVIDNMVFVGVECLKLLCYDETWWKMKRICEEISTYNCSSVS